jgi:hypothetical protein
MRKVYSIFLLAGLLVMSSCTKHIFVNYQTDSSGTGKVVLKPSKPTTKTLVTINDKLIVDMKNAKSVTINNLPIGEYSIHYTSDNSWYKDKLDVKIPLKVEEGSDKTMLVEVPPFSTGYWIYCSGAAILPWVILLAL